LLIESDDNTEEKLENLVLYSELQDGELGYIIKYNMLSDLGLTEEEVFESGVDEIDGLLTDNNTTGRVLYISYWVPHCIVGSNQGGYCGGDPEHGDFKHGRCGHWESAFIYIGDDTGFEGVGGGGDTGGGYLGSGGGTGTGSGIPTSPVTMTLEETLYKNFKKNTLTVAQNNWLTAQNLQNANVGISIMNYLSLNDYDTSSKSFITEIIDLLINDPSVDANALQFMINAKANNMFVNEIDETFIVYNASLFDYDITNTSMTILPPQLIMHFTIQCAVLRANHPDWSDVKIYYEATKDMLHLTLDIFGLVPVVGEPAYLINGTLYTIEGDGVNATLSFAGAIP
jgi:hypothetical protein